MSKRNFVKRIDAKTCVYYYPTAKYYTLERLDELGNELTVKASKDKNKILGGDE